MFRTKASERCGLIPPDIIEEDYWPCFLIDLLGEGLYMTVTN